jgi:mRNA interferase RelE/StbE
MPYEVKLHREVVKTLSELRSGIRLRIIQGLRALKDDPIHARPGADIVRLRGTRGRADLFRLRIGDYRAIYAIEDQVVYVTELYHRGRGYDSNSSS